MNAKDQHKGKQKIAIVTGGSSGIGKAIAMKFTECGIFSILIGRDRKRLADAAATMAPMAEAIVFDLNQLDGISDLVQKIAQKYQSIDILVNCAGIHMKKSMVEVTNEEFQQVILTNLTSAFVLSREVSKVMLKQRGGSILHISSMSAHYGLPLVIAYTAAKAGIEGLTRGMAVELSPVGIRVNCLAPGFIKTDMSASALDNDAERKHRVLQRTPAGKLGMPEEVARAALFLVSDDASYITGAVLPVDGGNAIGF
jgi:NAD(P)-dependent dehydrogenase (short-subunit alcohol dehydrogenase family)